jgi:hypothetical protein
MTHHVGPEPPGRFNRSLMRQALERLRTVLILVAIAGVSVGQTRGLSPKPSGRRKPGCEPRSLEFKPGWTSSAIWTADNSQLLVVDPLYRQILRYSEKGRALGPVPQGIGTALGSLPPEIILPDRSGFLLKLSDEQMIALDWNYFPRRRIDLKEQNGQDGTKAEGHFLLTTAGDDLVTLSDLHNVRTDTWSSAFIRFPMTAPNSFSALLFLPISSKARDLYRLNHPYLTSLGDTSYLVEMESAATLVKFPKGGKAEPMRVRLPGGQLPTLPSFLTRNDYPLVMKAVEQSAMPTGLYGWEGSLYLLSRAPLPHGGGTRWTLTKIDPLRERILWSASLPTRAHHLTVVPGARKWAFIEKGPVIAWGQQEIKSALFVPADRLRAQNPRANLCE